MILPSYHIDIEWYDVAYIPEKTWNQIHEEFWLIVCKQEGNILHILTVLHVALIMVWIIEKRNKSPPIISIFSPI